MPYAIIIPIASFVAIGALTWLVLGLFMGQDERAEQRLSELSDPRGRRGNDKEEKKTEALARALQKASPALAKPLTPTNEREMSKLKQDLIEAGFRSESAPMTYLAIRVFCSLIFLFLGGGISLIVYGVTPTAAVRTFVVGAIGFYLPMLGLSFLVKRRKKLVLKRKVK